MKIGQLIKSLKLLFTMCQILRLNNNNNHFMALWILSGTTWVSRYQKGKTILDLLEQEKVFGSGISWAICKCAPRPRQITMPASHHSVFTGRMDGLPATQPTASKH